MPACAVDEALHLSRTGGSDREMLATGMADPNLLPNADPNDVRSVVLGTLDSMAQLPYGGAYNERQSADVIRGHAALVSACCGRRVDLACLQQVFTGC